MMLPKRFPCYRLSMLAIRCFALILASAPLIAAADEPPAGESSVDIESVASLLELIIDADGDAARNCLNVLTDKLRTNELDAAALTALRQRLETTLKPILAGDSKAPLFVDVSLLAAYWKHPAAVSTVRSVFLDNSLPLEQRGRALDALVAINDPETLKSCGVILASDGDESRELQAAVLSSLGRSRDPGVARLVLSSYRDLAEDVKPKAIELLTQRAAWSKDLLAAIDAKLLPADALNANQVMRLQLSGDEVLRELVAKTWGTVREQRNPEREKVIGEMRQLLTEMPGDATRGQLVFNKLCGQCHKLHGTGMEVGPDITANGRNSYDQLLSNVFDPSLVIGAAYQPRVVVTDSGRVITGLLVEESDSRVVLKLQGGKQEVIPADEIEEIVTSQLSLMPEGVEKQLMPQEIADLFALLTLDRPPTDPQAQPIPGTPAR